jgi:hypothetical protein
MAERRDYGVAIAAAAAAALAIGSQRPASTSPPAPGTAAASSTVRAEGTGPRVASDRPLTDRVLDPLQSAREVVRHEGGKLGPIRPMDLKDLEIEFQIATVPDPIETRFGHRFDSVVDAIQVAVEARGYTLDRFYLPWRPSGEEPRRGGELRPTMEEPNELTEAVYTKLQAFYDWMLKPKPGTTWQAKSPSFPEPPPRQRVEPGALVFRKVSLGGKSTSQYCVILLVGESPVSGVQKDALLLALDLVRDYQVARRRPEPIRIVAPYFTSGSASLSRTLSDWALSEAGAGAWAPVLPALQVPTPPPMVSVLTGSSISTNPYHFEQACLPASARFRATVVPFSVVMSGLLEYLVQLHGGKKLPKLAILTESSTSFGQAPAPQPPGPDGAAPRAAPQGPREQWDVDYERYADQTLITRYPFHISQVAVEYSDRKNDDRDGRPTLARPSTRLHVPFDGGGSPDDTVPSLSLKSTSARDEFDLENILLTLAREDCRYIGIVATDTRDVIFLIGLIHEFCPDARIFSFEADLVLAHPDFVANLRGTILASPYPLHDATQRWTPYSRGSRDGPSGSDLTPQGRELFGYISDQGYYNAVLAQFAEARPQLAVSESPMMNAFDYGPIERTATTGNRPPVWISIVGEHGLWPLAYYVPDASRVMGKGAEKEMARENERGLLDAYTRYVYRGPDVETRPTEIQHATWGWLATYYGFSVMILGLCWASNRGLLGDAGGASWGKWLVLHRFWPIDDPAARSAQDLYIVACLWSLAMLSTPIAAIALLRPIGPASTCGSLLVLGYLVLSLIASTWPLPAFGGARGGTYPATRWSRRLYAMFWSNVALALAALVAAWALTAPAFDLWLGLMSVQAHVVVFVTVVQAIWVRASDSKAVEVSPFAIDRVAAVGLVLLALFEVLGLSVWVVPWAGPLAPHGFRSGVVHPYLDRVTSLAGGVSPVVPLVVLGLALVWSMLHHLRTLYLYGRVLVHGKRDGRPSVHFLLDVVLDVVDWLRGRRSGPTPAAPPEHHVPGVYQYSSALDVMQIDASQALRRNPAFLLALGLMIFGLARLLHSTLMAPDGWVFTYACIFLICASYFVVVTAFARFLLLWSRLRDLFRGMTQFPMWAAYHRLPPLVSQTYGRYLDRYDPRLSSLCPRVIQLMALAGRDEKARTIALRALEKPGGTLNDIGDVFKAEFETNDFADVHQSKIRNSLRCVVLEYLERLEREYWPSRTIREAYGSDDPAAKVVKKEKVKEKAEGTEEGGEDTEEVVSHRLAAGLLGGNAEEVVRAEPESLEMMAEDLIAMEFLAIVSQYAAHLRNLATYLALAPLLLVWAVSSYPFLPQRYMLVFLWGAWVTIVAGVVYVYIQMDRDVFLSHVSRTRPNHVTFDATFFSSILALIVPLLGVILAQFPMISDALNQWFGPILRVVR